MLNEICSMFTGLESKSVLQNASSNPCEENWEENGSHCYYWSTFRMNWTAAEKFCQNKSSHLASVTSRSTSDYISKKFSRRRFHVWIGGTDQDKEGLWKWTDLSPWNFADWEDGSPPDHNEEHNCLLQSRWGWDDVPCHVKSWFLCSRKKQVRIKRLPAFIIIIVSNAKIRQIL